MTDPQQEADRKRLRKLERELMKLKRATYREIVQPPQQESAVDVATISAEATRDASRRAGRATVISAAVAAVIGLSSAVTVATINNNSKTTPATNTSTTQGIDCTNELKDALEIYRLHPEITIPYANNDPVQQLCLLNEKVDEVRKADNP